MVASSFQSARCGAHWVGLIERGSGSWGQIVWQRQLSTVSGPSIRPLSPTANIVTRDVLASFQDEADGASLARPSCPRSHSPKRNRTPGLGARRPGDRGLRGGKPRASVLAGYAVGKRRSRNLSDHEVYSSPSSGPPTSSSSSIFWEDLRTAASISLARSLLAFRNSRTLSRPWPIRWLL